MRRSFQFLPMTLILSGTALAQIITAKQVPPVVKENFQAKFPAIKRVQWKFKADRNFEAEFALKGIEIAAKFDSTGKWLETESAAIRSRVPAAVLDTINEYFKGYKIVEIQTVHRWIEERLLWEIHLDGANEIIKAQFDNNGRILSQSAKPKLVIGT